jgi:hypothetical protein
MRTMAGYGFRFPYMDPAFSRRWFAHLHEIWVPKVAQEVLALCGVRLAPELRSLRRVGPY